MFEDPRRTILVEHLSPELDDGRYPIKRELGDSVLVEADIFKEGHDLLSAVVLYRPVGQAHWDECPMVHVDNDRWRGQFMVHQLGTYEYTVEAWVDAYGSWAHEVTKKLGAGENIESDLLEGQRLIEATMARADVHGKERIRQWLASWKVMQGPKPMVEAAGQENAMRLMRAYPDRSFASRYDRVLRVVVDRLRARFGAWYEMFPRSQGKDPSRSATFAECAERIPEIAALGFDVLYMPPIHPIGVTHRKGKNNVPIAQPDDPGCPYAIGSGDGGHTAVEPTLGTLGDFDALVAVCQEHGMEVALDFAVQCSPDHPYVKSHPEWFFKRPDGTIKYAENPPKKYEDIYPLDFMCEAYQSLWEEMRRVIEFWIGHGVKIFRVDNPHTKPLAFWHWLIAAIKEKHPETIFLAEAFTRPKMMRALAKLGFSQSYTYFTWRNAKQELIEYLTELTQTEMKEFYRGNFFTNTPDILPFFLQQSGRAGFKIRAVLAATLSSSYGIYNGFELCEGRALPGREEYADSEKYEFKVWDWNRKGHIKDLLRILNHARLENPALQEYDNLRFFHSDSDDILVYAKATHSRDNVVLAVVNLNPHAARESMVHIPPWELGVGENQPFAVRDLISGQRWVWRGWSNYVRLDPENEPAHLFVIERL